MKRLHVTKERTSSFEIVKGLDSLKKVMVSSAKGYHKYFTYRYLTNLSYFGLLALLPPFDRDYFLIKLRNFGYI